MPQFISLVAGVFTDSGSFSKRLEHPDLNPVEIFENQEASAAAGAAAVAVAPNAGDL